MATVATRFPINHRISAYDSQEFKFPVQPLSSFSDDMVFGFLEDGDDINHQAMPPAGSYNSDESGENEASDEDKESNGSAEENKRFWENQQQLLQDTLCRRSSFELRIRNVTKEALKEIQSAGTVCACGRPMASCKNCLMREVSNRLRDSGYNSAICRTKWRSSPHIPSGEHTFVDVIENSKKVVVRVIIELNFRAEFEMARASEEYNRLVKQLPEVFVGKAERLSNVIKILCTAAKKCMKERKMHMGPWRKQRYMQAKWLSTGERTTSSQELRMGEYSGRVPKPRASMLTVDLLGMLPNMHRTAVEVV